MSWSVGAQPSSAEGQTPCEVECHVCGLGVPEHGESRAHQDIYHRVHAMTNSTVPMLVTICQHNMLSQAESITNYFGGGGSGGVAVY